MPEFKIRGDVIETKEQPMKQGSIPLVYVECGKDIVELRLWKRDVQGLGRGLKRGDSIEATFTHGGRFVENERGKRFYSSNEVSAIRTLGGLKEELPPSDDIDSTPF